MPSIEEQNLTEFLAEVKLKMENITFSKQKDIQKINEFIFSSDGKYVRSKIIFLYGHRIGIEYQKLLELASTTELIHLSTLVHDDIIDEAPLRRGKPSVLKFSGIKKALLYGDYLYTKTFSCLNSLENKDIATVLINCAEKLIEGEFNQISAMTHKAPSLENYIKIIKAKTAVLFSGALQSIGIHAKFKDEDLNLLYKLGYEFGYAFQLNDDLIDFSNESVTGKVKYKDLSEGKFTYPLIAAFNDSTEEERKKIYHLIETKEYSQIVELIEKYNGFVATRIERDKSINNCIETTQNFIKLDSLDYVEQFLRDTLKA